MVRVRVRVNFTLLVRLVIKAITISNFDSS